MARPVRFSTRRKARRAVTPSDRLRALIGGVKKRATPKTEEHDAQVALFRDHIATRLHPDAVAFAIPNGGFRNKTVALKLKDEGATSGVPDIFAMHRGAAFFLELKRPKGGVVSKSQREMMERLTAAGAHCAVAKGLDEAVEQLERWGLFMTTAQQERAA